MKQFVVSPLAHYLLRLASVLWVSGCGAEASSDAPYPRRPLAADRLAAPDAHQVVDYLDRLIDQDPMARGRVLAFDLSPYRTKEQSKDELFSTLRSRLEALPTATLSSAQLQSRSQSMARLLESMRRGWDLQRRALERQAEQSVSDAEVLSDYFGGGTAFPVPYTPEQREAAARASDLVSTHPSPQSDGYLCVVFVDQPQRLGAELEYSLPFTLKPEFVERLNALDGDIAGSLIATHELAHCLHSKGVPRQFTGVMGLRHAETVADIVAYLRTPPAIQAFEPSALEDFRIVSSGLQVRRGRNTARGIALARHHVEAMATADSLQVASATISELAQFAEPFSLTSLREDFPVWGSLLPADQRDEYRRVGVTHKRLLRFAAGSLEGTVDQQQWFDEWSGQFGAKEAALLLRLQRAAERVFVPGQIEPLRAAVQACESQWPSSFAAARLRLEVRGH